MIDALTKQKADFEQQIKDIKSQNALDLANVQNTFAKVQTPQQTAALLAQLMGLKQPPVVFTPPATKDDPHPTPQIELPDAPQVKAYFQACEECKVNYAAAQTSWSQSRVRPRWPRTSRT